MDGRIGCKSGMVNIDKKRRRGGARSTRPGQRACSLVDRVDLQAVDEPVAVGKGAGVVGDVVIARAVASGRGTAAARPDVAGPLPAKGCVKDNVVVLDVVVEAAAGKVRHGRAPSGRRRSTVGDVGWHAAPRPVPHLDAAAVPKGRVHTTTGVVEASTVAVGCGRVDGATWGQCQETFFVGVITCCGVGMLSTLQGRGILLGVLASGRAYHCSHYCRCSCYCRMTLIGRPRRP